MLSYKELDKKIIQSRNGELRYLCHTAYELPDGQNTTETTYFQIEDIDTEKFKPDYAELLTNGSCYHTTLKDCLSGIFGTLRQIMYKGVNINPYKRSVLLRYNVNTGECYPDIELDWSTLESMEAS